MEQTQPTSNEMMPWDEMKGVVEAQKASFETPPSPNTPKDDDPTMPWNVMKKLMQSGEAFIDSVFTRTPRAQPKVGMATGAAPKTDIFGQVFKNLIQAESRGRHTDDKGNLTTSPVGAQGITQVMPKTAKDPGYGVQPIKDGSEGEFLRFGEDYLRAMLKEFNGDYRKALAAYNHGPGGVRKAIMKAGKAGHDDWLSLTPAETRNYVGKIMKGIKNA